MSKYAVLGLVVLYCLIGIFVSGVLDDSCPSPLLMLFWPLVIAILILLLIVGGIFELGKKVGDMLGR